MAALAPTALAVLISPTGSEEEEREREKTFVASQSGRRAMQGGGAQPWLMSQDV